MIYHVYWMGIEGGPRSRVWNGVEKWDPAVELAELIKLTEDDSFVFVTLVRGGYHDRFMAWVESNGLKDLITFQSEPITNPVHSGNGPNLVVTVITCKEHFWREMMPDDSEEGVCAI